MVVDKLVIVRSHDGKESSNISEDLKFESGVFSAGLEKAILEEGELLSYSVHKLQLPIANWLSRNGPSASLPAVRYEADNLPLTNSENLIGFRLLVNKSLGLLSSY
jgi:hypothetical protein